MTFFFFFFQAEDGIRDLYVTGVQTCALPICWTYELPALQSGGTAARKLTEGWAISGITNYHSGDPLDLRVASSQLNNGAGSNANWPNVTCSTIDTVGTVDKWFD